MILYLVVRIVSMNRRKRQKASGQLHLITIVVCEKLIHDFISIMVTFSQKKNSASASDQLLLTKLLTKNSKQLSIFSKETTIDNETLRWCTFYHTVCNGQFCLSDRKHGSSDESTGKSSQSFTLNVISHEFSFSTQMTPLIHPSVRRRTNKHSRWSYCRSDGEIPLHGRILSESRLWR